MLPDEEAVDRHLRLLLWQGLKESIKDKPGPKKESCKTFAELIAAARYGEKEANSTWFPRRVVHQNFVSETGLMETHIWNGFHRCAQQCPARLGKLPLINNRPGIQENSFPINGVTAAVYGRKSHKLPTCYRCGQRVHVRIGCRDLPIDPDSFQESGNYSGPLTRGSNTA